MQSAATLTRCPVCGFPLPGELPRPTPESPAFCPRPSCGVEFLACEPDRVRLRTFRLLDHYSLCVLPFSFDRDGAEVCARLAASGRWAARTFSLDDPDDVDRTEYFLPYIRRFLFPTLYRAAPGTDGDRARAEPTCRHFDFDLARLGPANGKGLPLSLRCWDSRKNLGFDYPLLLERAQLVLFHYRVGFLVLRFRCADTEATFFDQMNALVYLRAIAPLYRGFDMPRLATDASAFRVPQLLPYLLAEFGAGPPPLVPADVPAGAALPVRPVYDDRMMVYTFSCLERETCLADPERCRRLLRQGTVIDFEDDPEAAHRDRPEGGDPDEWLRTRWQGFSKEGGSLAVFNTDRFHERFLGVYHGTYYFDIFLLATLQRVTLLALFERLSDIEALTTGGLGSSQRMRRVRRDLLLFKNQC